jgi:hypothetical protein
MYKVEIAYRDILLENTRQFEFGPGLMIFDSYPPWIWKNVKYGMKTLTECGRIRGVDDT